MVVEFKPKHTPKPMLIIIIIGGIILFLFVFCLFVMDWKGLVIIGVIGGVVWFGVIRRQFPAVIKLTNTDLTIHYLDYLSKAHTLVIPLHELSAELLEERVQGRRYQRQLVLYLFQNKKRKMRIDQFSSGFTPDELNRLYQAIKAD